MTAEDRVAEPIKLAPFSISVDVVADRALATSPNVNDSNAISIDKHDQ